MFFKRFFSPFVSLFFLLNIQTLFSYDHDDFFQTISDYLSNLQQDMLTIEKIMDDFVQSSSEIQEYFNQIKQIDCIGSEGSNYLNNTIPQWVTFAQVTSPQVTILKKNSDYYAVFGTNKCYLLHHGDHNLWFAANGDLWGYDKRSKIFHYLVSEAVEI